MTNTIYASFADPAMAEKAAGALLDHGVKSEEISVIFPEGYSGFRSDVDKDADHIHKTAEQGITTTTMGDATSGATKGAGIGLAAGALAALAAVFIPGFGIVLGGGALATAIGGMAGTAAAGAVAGGVTGYLKDQGVPDQAVQDYDNVLRGGGSVLMVSAAADGKVARDTIYEVISKYNGRASNYAGEMPTSAVVYGEDTVGRLEPADPEFVGPETSAAYTAANPFMRPPSTGMIEYDEDAESTLYTADADSRRDL